ncbi:hypothetical protein KKB18_00445, partial [bacterium]|nr:hypothetical protein [bacterium]
MKLILSDDKEVLSLCEGASFLGSTTDKILNVMFIIGKDINMNLLENIENFGSIDAENDERLI